MSGGGVGLVVLLAQHHTSPPPWSGPAGGRAGVHFRRSDTYYKHQLVHIF